MFHSWFHSERFLASISRKSCILSKGLLIFYTQEVQLHHVTLNRRLLNRNDDFLVGAASFNLGSSFFLLQLRATLGESCQVVVTYGGCGRLEQNGQAIYCDFRRFKAILGETESRFCDCARFWFLTRRSRIQKCENKCQFVCNRDLLVLRSLNLN